MKIIKKKRKELLKILEGLENFKGENEKSFNMYVALNVHKFKEFKEELKIILESKTAPKDFQEYQEKENKLINTYGIKDDKGDLVLFDNKMFKIKEENVKKYQEEKKKLEETYKTSIDAMNEIILEENDLMEGEVSLEIIEIPFKALPELLDIKQQMVILDLISNFED